MRRFQSCHKITINSKTDTYYDFVKQLENNVCPYCRIGELIFFESSYSVRCDICDWQVWFERLGGLMGMRLVNQWAQDYMEHIAANNNIPHTYDLANILNKLNVNGMLQKARIKNNV